MPYLGYHGWDPKFSDMKGIFMAQGPAFRRNCNQPRMSTTDVYPLVCHLLKLKTCRRTKDGLKNIEDMLLNAP